MHRIDLKAYTPNSISSPLELIEEVVRVRGLGWASTDGEFAPGVVGCAVPLLNKGGKFIAGLGVSVPAAHCAHAEVYKFIPDLLACAAAISRDLGTGP